MRFSLELAEVAIANAKMKAFRNVVPKAVENFLKESQTKAWENKI